VALSNHYLTIFLLVFDPKLSGPFKENILGRDLVWAFGSWALNSKIIIGLYGL
jgi:hypothetical protein